MVFRWSKNQRYGRNSDEAVSTLFFPHQSVFVFPMIYLSPRSLPQDVMSKFECCARGDVNKRRYGTLSSSFPVTLIIVIIDQRPSLIINKVSKTDGYWAENSVGEFGMDSCRGKMRNAASARFIS